MLTKHEEDLVKEGCHICKIDMPEINKPVWWLTPWGELILSKLVDSLDTDNGVVKIDLSWVVKIQDEKFRFLPVFDHHVWREFQPERLNPEDPPPVVGGRYVIV